MTAPDTERPAGLDCLDPSLALPLWRQQEFRLLWGAQVVSTLGSHAVGIVVPLLILALTNSPAAVGLASALGVMVGDNYLGRSTTTILAG